MKKSTLLPVIGIVTGLFLLSTVYSAGNSNTAASKEGKSQEKAIILVPLPFDQETDPYTLAPKDDSLWFLFYASKGENYIFEFTEENGTGEIRASFYGGSVTPDLETSKKMGDKKSFTVSFTAKDHGNYYIKLSVAENSTWKGKLKYYIGKLPQS
jgi:hypothetical protein